MLGFEGADGSELLCAGWSGDGAVLRPEEIESAMLEGEGADGLVMGVMRVAAVWIVLHDVEMVLC